MRDHGELVRNEGIECGMRWGMTRSTSTCIVKDRNDSVLRYEGQYSEGE